ncbi:unnamed protein product [Rotaria sp. Silwood1]|nr:unnamed protein product [Rotaria sp. Silwood1]
MSSSYRFIESPTSEYNIPLNKRIDIPIRRSSNHPNSQFYEQNTQNQIHSKDTTLQWINDSITGNEKFRIRINIEGFNQNEVHIRVDENKLFVYGEHIEKKSQGTSKKVIDKFYELPSDVDTFSSHVTFPSPTIIQVDFSSKYSSSTRSVRSSRYSSPRKLYDNNVLSNSYIHSSDDELPHENRYSITNNAHRIPIRQLSIDSSLFSARSISPTYKFRANIGTSITNTLVAFSQIGNRNEFSRSFSSGILMDVFNYLTTLVLLPIEIFIDRITTISDIFHRGGYLARVSGAIAAMIPEKQGMNIQLLKVITKPLTKLIIQIDKTILMSNTTKQTVGKIYCYNETIKCKYLFRSMIENFGDNIVGIILFICSLLILIGILLFMVKLLKSIIIGVIDDTLKKILHIQSHGWKEYLLGYVFVIIGIIGAILVQSSSIFCSILTPLVGLEVLSLERNYELTIGANIGTTITALLASLTQTGLFFRQSIQIALTHFLFNVSGCILWYILPYFRRIPIYLSRQIGEIVSEYRWFALIYITLIFFLFPLILLILALIHWIVASIFLLCIFLLTIFILIIKYFQKTNPNKLPIILQSWSFLPRSFRSFSYWDHHLEIFIKYICCQRCINLIYPSNTIENPLKEQYLSMKTQYLTALDHHFLIHTQQLNQLFEKYHAPIIPIYESQQHSITNDVQDFYHSLTGKPIQGEKTLLTFEQTNLLSKEINIHENEEDLIDRIIVFDREKKKEISVNEYKSSLSF